MRGRGRKGGGGGGSALRHTGTRAHAHNPGGAHSRPEEVVSAAAAKRSSSRRTRATRKRAGGRGCKCVARAYLVRERLRLVELRPQQLDLAPAQARAQRAEHAQPRARVQLKDQVEGVTAGKAETVGRLPRAACGLCEAVHAVASRQLLKQRRPAARAHEQRRQHARHLVRRHGGRARVQQRAAQLTREAGNAEREDSERFVKRRAIVQQKRGGRVGLRGADERVEPRDDACAQGQRQREEERGEVRAWAGGGGGRPGSEQAGGISGQPRSQSRGTR